VTDVLDAFDRFLAVASGGDAPPRAELSAGAALARRARERFGGETLVVALVGGTGSGTSAVANALAGAEILDSGPLRPTTTRPAALVPDPPEPGLVPHLRRLGIADVHPAPRLSGIALLDLPDTDSVAEENGRAVDRLLPLVDAVVWVVDPEKYHDRILHAGLVRRLAAHSPRFVFVLNQLDRVPLPDRAALLAHLGAILREDGIVDPVIVGMAADPPAGAPEGVEELAAALSALGAGADVAAARLLTDVDGAVDAILAASRSRPGPSAPAARTRPLAPRTVPVAVLLAAGAVLLVAGVSAGGILLASAGGIVAAFPPDAPPAGAAPASPPVLRRDEPAGLSAAALEVRLALAAARRDRPSDRPT